MLRFLAASAVMKLRWEERDNLGALETPRAHNRIVLRNIDAQRIVLKGQRPDHLGHLAWRDPVHLTTAGSGNVVRRDDVDVDHDLFHVLGFLQNTFNDLVPSVALNLEGVHGDVAFVSNRRFLDKEVTLRIRSGRGHPSFLVGFPYIASKSMPMVWSEDLLEDGANLIERGKAIWLPRFDVGFQEKRPVQAHRPVQQGGAETGSARLQSQANAAHIGRFDRFSGSVLFLSEATFLCRASPRGVLP